MRYGILAVACYFLIRGTLAIPVTLFLIDLGWYWCLFDFGFGLTGAWLYQLADDQRFRRLGLTWTCLAVVYKLTSFGVGFLTPL